jgi:hypothetical protein
MFDWKSFATGFLNETGRQMELDRLENVKYKDELRDDYKVAKKAFQDRKALVGQAQSQVGRLKKLGANDQQIKAAAATGAKGVFQLADALAAQQEKLNVKRQLTPQEIDVFITGASEFEAGDVAEFIERSYNFSTAAPDANAGQDPRSGIQKLFGINLREATDAAYGSSASAFGPSKMDLIDMSREAAYKSLATDPSSVFLTIDEAQRDPYNSTAVYSDFIDEYEFAVDNIKDSKAYTGAFQDTDLQEKMVADAVKNVARRYAREHGDEWIVDSPSYLKLYTDDEVEAARERLEAKQSGRTVSTKSSAPERKIKEVLTSSVANDQGSSIISAPDEEGDTIELSFGIDGKPIGAYSVKKDKTKVPVSFGEDENFDDFLKLAVKQGIFTQKDLDSMEVMGAASFSDASLGKTGTALGEAPEVEKIEEPKPRGAGKPTPFQRLAPKIKKWFSGLPAFKQRRLRKEAQEKLELSEARADSFDPTAEAPLVNRRKVSIIPAAEASERPDEDFTQDATKVEIERIMDFLEGEEEMDASLLSNDTAGLFKFLEALEQEDLPEDLTNDIQDYLKKVEAEEQGDDVGDPLIAPGIRVALEEPTADSVDVPDVKTEDMEIEDYLDKGGEDAIKYFFDVYAKKKGYYSDKTRLIKEWERYAAKSSIVKPVIKIVADKLRREVRP